MHFNEEKTDPQVVLFCYFSRGSVFISSKFCFQLFPRRTPHPSRCFSEKKRRKRSKRSSTYESLAMVCTGDPPTCSKHQKVNLKKQWVVVIWWNYDNYGFNRNLSVLLEVCSWKAEFYEYRLLHCFAHEDVMDMIPGLQHCKIKGFQTFSDSWFQGFSCVVDLFSMEIHNFIF